MFEAFSIIFLIAAILSYVNYRWIGWPSTIGTMTLSLLVAGLLVLSKDLVPSLYELLCNAIIEADLKTLLLEVMLSVLLFAGAIHVDIQDLKKEKWAILLFSTLGVLISTGVVGILLYYSAPVFGLNLPIIFCFLFGALISPTDPIAVIAIIKKAQVSKSLELKIEGESLFNDGVGVVLFTSVLLLASTTQSDFSMLSAEIGKIFLTEAIGGILMGLILGWTSLQTIRTVQENGQLVIILTIATVLGGYAIAHHLGTSGPLATVVAGLIIGNGINHGAFESSTRKMTNEIWQILDESLNAMLFVLIGLSIHLVKFDWNVLWLGMVSILIVLLSRALSVMGPYALLGHKKHEFWQTSAILTWGGLRGGISLALAMSLPDKYYGSELLLLCFVVVVFSILGQGLSLGRVVKKVISQS